MPLYVLILLFICVPMIEFWLLYQAGTMFLGFWGTLGIIVITGVIGSTLARREGLRTLTAAQRTAQSGRIPTDAMIDGLLIFLAGGVLLTPGFLTDAIGFLLLIPPVRAFLRNRLKAHFKHKVMTMHTGMGPQPGFGAGMQSGPFEVHDATDDGPLRWQEVRPEDGHTRKPDVVIEAKKTPESGGE